MHDLYDKGHHIKLDSYVYYMILDVIIGNFY